MIDRVLKPAFLARLLLLHLNRRPQAKGAAIPMPGSVPAPPAEALTQLRRATGLPSFPQRLSSLQIKAWRRLSIPGAEDMRAARLYRPRGRVRGAVLFLHGGGFVHCDLRSHHGICCRLARQSGAMVLSLDYRLAPEHKFPSAHEDAWAALLWLGRQMDGRGPIAVAGDSAGGNLAAALAQRARDHGLALAGQLLVYPALTGGLHVPSRDDFAHGYMLTAHLMGWYGAQYLSCPEELHDPGFAPALAEDLTGLAPCMIQTAGFDPMCGEGTYYRDRLRAAGVCVQYRANARMIHGFWNFYALMLQGRRAIREGAAFLRDCLASTGI